MTLSHLPPVADQRFPRSGPLARQMLGRAAAPVLLLGILFARGRRTVTSWFRAAGIREEFRPAYVTVCAIGREAEHMAITTLLAVKPCWAATRLTVAIDDTPTARYGPQVEGAGIHHNPSPGPRRREARLRPCLGHPGRPGQAPR